MRLIIVGASSFGKTVRDIAIQSKKYEEIVFLDDDLQHDNNEVVGVVCDFGKFISESTEFIVAIGDNKRRYNILICIAEAGGKIARLIHPTAYVSPTATIGVGTIILPNASVGTDVVIAYGCIINMGSIIDHKVFLGVGVHIAPGAIVKGDNVIESFSKIESGEVIQRGTFPIADSKL